VPVPHPRLAAAQCATFAAGAAALLLVSAIGLCANMWPMLLRAILDTAAGTQRT
jgi:hypothetical protein